MNRLASRYLIPRWEISRIYKYFLRAGKKISRHGVYNSITQTCLRFETRWFDLKYGVDTHRNIQLNELGISSSNVEHGVHYQPILINHLRKILVALDPTPKDVLVDFGSGKGNVLLVSSMYPLKRVVGVEFSDSLCEIAAENVRRFRVSDRSEVEINCIDAVDYKIKKDETIFYFFNPFDQVIMRKVIDNIKSSFSDHPRKIRIVYYNLRSQDLRASSPEFELTTDKALHGIPFQIYELI